MRRSSSQPRSVNRDDRDDVSGTSKSKSPEPSTSPSRLAQSGSFRRSKSQGTTARDDPSVVTSRTAGLFRADKRQKKVVFTSFSDNPYAVLEIRVEEHAPTPKDKTHVVLKVFASTISYSDCMLRRGIGFDVINPTGVPSTPGMDVVGTVVSVGENVKSFQAGDRVAALVRTGGNARYISVPESDLVQVPRTCDAAEAASMVSTYMTAYQCLRLVSNDTFMLNNKRILITGGIEPVGQALIQLCFRAGAAEVYATAPNHRHRYLRTVLGARPLPVDPKLWLDSMKGSMDIAFDGTCHDSLDSASASLNQNGVLVSHGMSALLKQETPGLLGAPLSAYWAKLKSRIMTNSMSYEVWDSFVADKEKFKLDLEVLLHLLKKRFIKPHIAKKVALSEVAEAHESLEKETSRGEIICLPWKRSGK